MASTQFFIFAILAVLVPSILATDFVGGDNKGCVKALIQAELQDSKADDRAPEVDDKAAGKRPVV